MKTNKQQFNWQSIKSMTNHTQLSVVRPLPYFYNEADIT